MNFNICFRVCGFAKQVRTDTVGLSENQSHTVRMVGSPERVSSLYSSFGFLFNTYGKILIPAL